jgi:hypothetical protein
MGSNMAEKKLFSPVIQHGNPVHCSSKITNLRQSGHSEWDLNMSMIKTTDFIYSA